MPRILILGGTSEARTLAGRLASRADLEIMLSLAGRTAAPAAQGVPVRVGGFGGVAGLAEYLVRERIDALIDATHPFATIISANAAAAARQTAVPFTVLLRPAWAAVPGDRWIEVANVAAAVHALGDRPRGVFVALGRNEIARLVAAPWHRYLIRSVDPVEPPLDLPHATYLTARGPFAEANERALLTAQRIDVVVAKNSGGSASYGKIAAARALGIDVIMLRRPVPAEAATVATVDDAVAWLDHALTLTAARGV